MIQTLAAAFIMFVLATLAFVHYPGTLQNAQRAMRGNHRDIPQADAPMFNQWGSMVIGNDGEPVRAREWYPQQYE